MAARLGLRTVVLDCDPQSDLSALFLGDEKLVELWERAGSGRTVASCLELHRCGKREVEHPDLMVVEEGLWLLPGHLSLSRFEQSLADEWAKTSAGDDEHALAVTTALDLLSNRAASAVAADLVLLDVEPSLGALNRSAVLACDALGFPLVPDFFNLLALRNVGPAIREWRRDWDVVRDRYLTTRSEQDLPDHRFQSIGYIVQLGSRTSPAFSLSPDSPGSLCST
jgi:cellulose biosynthesis protein BcsQ